MLTKEQIQASLEAVIEIAKIIEKHGAIPSGHLYAELMDHIDLENYYKLIALIKETGLVEEKNHLLIWVGPPNESPIKPISISEDKVISGHHRVKAIKQSNH